MSGKFALRKRKRNQDEQFLELFANHITNTHQCAELLQQFFAGREADGDLVGAVEAKEHAGDRLAKQVYELLNQAYITQIDKSDIQNLIHALDNVVDEMKKVVFDFKDRNMQTMRNEAQEFTKIILGMCAILERLVSHLGKLRSDELEPCILEIKEMEEQGDALRRQAIFNLNRTVEKVEQQSDPMQYLKTWRLATKWEGIFSHLEKITDYCEEVVETIGDIVAKSGR